MLMWDVGGLVCYSWCQPPSCVVFFMRNLGSFSVCWDVWPEPSRCNLCLHFCQLQQQQRSGSVGPLEPGRCWRTAASLGEFDYHEMDLVTLVNSSSGVVLLLGTIVQGCPEQMVGWLTCFFNLYKLTHDMMLARHTGEKKSLIHSKG